MSSVLAPRLDLRKIEAPYRVFYKVKREDECFLMTIVRAACLEDAIAKLKAFKDFTEAYVVLDVGTWVEG